MGTQTTKTRSKLLNPLRGAATDALEGAGSLYDQSADLPSQYVGISPERQQALDMRYGLATGGAQVPGAALGEYRRVLGGEYLDPSSNPYLQEIVARSAGQQQRELAGQFGRSGRFGSGAHANALANARAQVASRVYGDYYQQQRDQLQRAIGMAPSMDALAYANLGEQAAVGEQYEADELMQRAEAIRQYLWPYQRLGMLQQSQARNPLMAEMITKTKQPFDWGAAGIGIVSELLGGAGAAMGGMGGGGGGGGIMGGGGSP